MTVSGTTTYSPTTNTVINRALRMVGAYAASSTPRPEQVSDALEVLNMMLKAWQTQDNLWLKRYCTLFLNKGQTSYNLAGSDVAGFSHCATDYIQTTVAVSALYGDSSVTLTAATGISAGDFVGIADDNGLIQWFYADLSGNLAVLFSDSTLTTPATLTAAATAGNLVYSHTVASQIERPTRVFLASRKLYNATAAEGMEIPLNLISRSEYQQLPNKTTESRTVSVYYDPQLDAGKFYVWPTAIDNGDKIVLTVDRPINIQTTDLETYDLPAEWLECMSYGLAVRLWPEYPTTGADYQVLASTYLACKESIQSYDREPVSSFVSMSPY